MEIMHLYTKMPNGVYRGIREKAAMEELADERTALSKYRLDSQRIAQGDDRRQAAVWREKHERERQIAELHWVLQDPDMKKTASAQGAARADSDRRFVRGGKGSRTPRCDYSRGRHVCCSDARFK